MTSYEFGDCPGCGTAEATPMADAADIRAEIEQLWEFHVRRLRPGTPPARLHDRLAFSQQPALRIVRCSACTLLYRNPRERADRITRMYRDEKPEPATLAALRRTQYAAFRAQARRLTRIFGRPGLGLEVGSYVGGFLDAATELGWLFHGVDVNPDAARFARSNGHTVHTGEIQDIDRDTVYDVVAFWNCFDQLADPRAAALAAARRLRAGGLLVIRVPSGAFYARWRRRLHSPAAPLARALLAHNNLLAFPYRHGFSIPSLQRLLASVGCHIRTTIGDALVPIADDRTRTWATIEERAVKTLLSRLPPRHAPWLEVYARRD